MIKKKGGTHREVQRKYITDLPLPTSFLLTQLTSFKATITEKNAVQDFDHLTVKLFDSIHCNRILLHYSFVENTDTSRGISTNMKLLLGRTDLDLLSSSAALLVNDIHRVSLLVFHLLDQLRDSEEVVHLLESQTLFT
jgi:hypothetical protein